jgi:hypothetical protein
MVKIFDSMNMQQTSPSSSSGNKIINHPLPTSDGDVANKYYVDSVGGRHPIRSSTTTNGSTSSAGVANWLTLSVTCRTGDQVLLLFHGYSLMRSKDTGYVEHQTWFRRGSTDLTGFSNGRTSAYIQNDASTWLDMDSAHSAQWLDTNPSTSSGGTSNTYHVRAALYKSSAMSMGALRGTFTVIVFGK